MWEGGGLGCGATGLDILSEKGSGDFLVGVVGMALRGALGLVCAIVSLALLLDADSAVEDTTELDRLLAAGELIILTSGVVALCGATI
jgi:hypothetical protein